MRKDANLVEDLPSRGSPHPTMGSSKHSSVPSPCPMPQEIESSQSISSTLDSIGRSSRQPQLPDGGKERSEGHSSPSNRLPLQRQVYKFEIASLPLVAWMAVLNYIGWLFCLHEYQMVLYFRNPNIIWAKYW